MRFRAKWVLVLLLSAGLLLVTLAPARATPPLPPVPTPQTPTVPPRPPFAPPAAGSEAAAAAVTGLPPLKAVLLVGPIDGDEGSWTNDEKDNMDLAAAELEAHGVTVFKFYTPNNDWGQIKAAAEGAQFLFYHGHGPYWGEMPYPPVGGFALKDRYVSADEIRTDLHLAPNAIIMLYGCFTAGSAGNDTISIDSAEAKRRVAQYSDPFFDIGASGYYADWFGNAFQMFTHYLCQDKTLGQAYEAYFDFNSNAVERYTHPDHPEMALWLDKDDWYDPEPQYNNAFVGQPSRTLADLFPGPSMVVTPPDIVYAAEPGAAARDFAVQVDDGGSGGLTWTATITPAVPWASAWPLGGSSGQQVTVTITPTLVPGDYQASLRVVAGDPQVGDEDQAISVTLSVVGQVHRAYLPGSAGHSPG
jgi:hypothetical protein